MCAAVIIVELQSSFYLFQMLGIFSMHIASTSLAFPNAFVTNSQLGMRNFSAFIPSTSTWGGGWQSWWQSRND